MSLKKTKKTEGMYIPDLSYKTTIYTPRMSCVMYIQNDPFTTIHACDTTNRKAINYLIKAIQIGPV